MPVSVTPTALAAWACNAHGTAHLRSRLDVLVHRAPRRVLPQRNESDRTLSLTTAARRSAAQHPFGATAPHVLAARRMALAGERWKRWDLAARQSAQCTASGLAPANANLRRRIGPLVCALRAMGRASHSSDAPHAQSPRQPPGTPDALPAQRFIAQLTTVVLVGGCAHAAPTSQHTRTVTDRVQENQATVRFRDAESWAP